jgi:hypothetical protein
MNLGQVSAMSATPKSGHSAIYSVTSSASCCRNKWHFRPENLGGLEVDDQLKFGQLFDWQVSRSGFKSAATEEILKAISLSNSSYLNKILHL